MTFISSVPSPLAFQPGEKVDQGFVRVLGQLEVQMSSLTQHAHRTLPESVHDTRLLIKRLRFLLWFASPAFSSSELNPLKAHLRNASHLLAAQRDFVVMRSIVEKLSRKISNPADRTTLVRIANAQDSQQVIAAKPDQSLQQAVAILLRTIKQLKEKAKNKSRWPTSSDRLAKAFLGNEKSGAKALRRQGAAQFHDWRKKAKRLLYQLQLTQAVPGKRMTHTINRVDALQEKLGDYHDSVIAIDRLQKDLSVKLPLRFVRHSVKLLEKRKHRLLKEVRKIAKHIRSR